MACVRPTFNGSDDRSILKKRKEKMDLQPGRDMLSELPLSLIHVILALVPIVDAVRTSILSRQWRYTWTSLPHLVFEGGCLTRNFYKSSIDEFYDCIEEFITQVLVLHNGPIHKFKLSFPFVRNCRNIRVWLLCLSRNDIRELIIDLAYSEFSGKQELRSSIYSCKMLTKLELYNCELDPPPTLPTTFKGFLFLRRLFVEKVYLSANDVQSLVANCPVLEEFTSINCGISQLRISAPNLKVLPLLDHYIEMSVYAPLLAELSIQLEDDGFTSNHQQQNSLVCNYTDFIGGFTNLEKLHGAVYFIKYLSMGIEYCRHTLVFHRLTDIALNLVDFEETKDVSVLARLIVGAPSLQKLKISTSSDIDRDDDASEVPHVSFSTDFGCAPNFKLEKLSVVKLNNVTGSLPHQMAFIRFLLERSPVLETMIFFGLSSVKKQNLSAKLKGCNLASPNAKLWLFTKELKPYR